MGDVTYRGYEDADALATNAMFDAAERHWGGQPQLTVENLRVFVAQRVGDPAADTRLACTADGRVAGAMLVAPPPPAGDRLDLIGAVHPDFHGQGIGTALLGFGLTRAEEQRRALAPDATWTVSAFAFTNEDPTLRLFEKLGLAPTRYWLDMVAPTADVPDAPLPAGFDVAPFRPELERRLHAAHMEAFADHYGFQQRPFETWASMTVRLEMFRSDLSLCAFEGNELAAYVLAYTSPDPTRLYIGQVGTRRPWRRRGLAGALIGRILTEARAQGFTHAALGVDAASPTGATGVYERVGFTTEQEGVSYTVELKNP